VNVEEPGACPERAAVFQERLRLRPEDLPVTIDDRDAQIEQGAVLVRHVEQRSFRREALIEKVDFGAFTEPLELLDEQGKMIAEAVREHFRLEQELPVLSSLHSCP
jgi:hypothetical protein